MQVGMSQIARALQALEKHALVECFDAHQPTSRPSPKQQIIFDDLGSVRHRYVVAANQIGKTAIGVNELRWLLTGTHPTFVRPSQWGSEPLLLLCLSRTTGIIEDNIWAKLRPFLNEADIKVDRQGGNLKRVTHIPTGNRVIFLSHHDVKAAREKSQGYVCHWAWIDEMPNSLEFINEIEMRVREKRGFFLATFTPLIKNDKIRRYVDGLEAPFGKKYQLDFTANPNNIGREEEIIASYKDKPHSQMRTRLYGDWSTGEGTVFLYDPELQLRSLPDTYHVNWPHYEAVDPASGTKLGYLLFTQDPSTHFWYIIRDDYVEDIYVPTLIVEEVKKKSEGYNMVGRCADGHETWYINQAAADNIFYDVPMKRNRKSELIANLQEALGKELFITPGCVNIVDELINCTWNEDQTAIVSGSTYHLLDAAQYFIDCKPAQAKMPRQVNSWYERLREDNAIYERKEAAKAAKTKSRGRLVRFKGTRGRARWIQ